MTDTVLEVLFLLGYMAGSVIRAPYTKRPVRDRIEDVRSTGQGRMLLLPAFFGMALVPFLYVVTPWLDFADYQLPIWAGWLGVVILALALWLFWRSHAELGHNWFLSLQIKEEHALVTEGVFRHIRHPMYASQWLWGMAQPLMLQNWIAGLSGLVGFLPMYLLRVPREEQMMLEHFGEVYTLYMNQTGRVIPRSWRLSDGKSAGTA